MASLTGKTADLDDVDLIPSCSIRYRDIGFANYKCQ